MLIDAYPYGQYYPRHMGVYDDLCFKKKSCLDSNFTNIHSPMKGTFLYPAPPSPLRWYGSLCLQSEEGRDPTIEQRRLGSHSLVLISGAISSNHLILDEHLGLIKSLSLLFRTGSCLRYLILNPSSAYWLNGIRHVRQLISYLVSSFVKWGQR